jgi:hypothetical protein
MPTASPPVSLEHGSKAGSFSEKVNQEFLTITSATLLPTQVVIDAYTEAYFMHLCHRVPVVDRADLAVAQPSVLLLQALCLTGALLRHPRGLSCPLVGAEPFYVKVKTLLNANHEKDSLLVLKALCLISLWNVTPPIVVTFDCAWHWLGVAIRMAVQMGLHREATYVRIADQGSARRVAWFLYVSLELFG